MRGEGNGGNRPNLGKPLPILMILLLGMVMIFLVTGSGSIGDVFSQYNTLTNGGKAGITPQLQFLRVYTITTGDTSLALSAGLSQDEIDNLIENGHTGDDNGGGTNPPPTITETDITGIAMMVAQQYTVNGVGYYVNDGSDSYARTSYNSVTYNGNTAPPYSSSGVYYRCCNGLSSAILKLLGITTYNDGSNISSSWPYISCVDIYNKVGTLVNVTTAGDLEVGDIICVKGDGRVCCHVETVVKKDNQYVYIASAGSSNGITLTAQQGYQRKFEYSKNLNSFYNSGSWDGLAGVKRP